MERVAIVGSRSWPEPTVVRNFVMRLAKGTVIVTGGARGVDTYAETSAKRYGMEIVVYRADWEKYGRSAGPRRNRQIVDDSDRVVAFWDGASPGTRDAVEYAKRSNKPVTIVYPNGRMEHLRADEDARKEIER